MKYFLLLLSLPSIWAFLFGEKWWLWEQGYKIPDYLTPRYTRKPGWGTTEAPLAFEVVDYESMPTGLYIYHHDCRAHYFQCLRYTYVFQPTCAFNWHTHKFENYNSHCEIDLQNCMHRLNKGQPFKGRLINEHEVLFFNGEGVNCGEYARSGNMIESYFGPGSTEEFKKKGLRSYKYLNQTYNL